MQIFHTINTLIIIIIHELPTFMLKCKDDAGCKKKNMLLRARSQTDDDFPLKKNFNRKVRIEG